MSAREPLACSLAGDEMVDRQAELRAIFGGRVVEVVREGNALRVELRDSAGLSQRLQRIARLERKCCPFLDLAVERKAGHLVVQIEGPPEARALIDAFDELVGPER